MLLRIVCLLLLPLASCATRAEPERAKKKTILQDEHHHHDHGYRVRTRTSPDSHGLETKIVIEQGDQPVIEMEVEGPFMGDIDEPGLRFRWRF